MRNISAPDQLLGQLHAKVPFQHLRAHSAKVGTAPERDRKAATETVGAEGQPEKGDQFEPDMATPSRSLTPNCTVWWVQSIPTFCKTKSQNHASPGLRAYAEKIDAWEESYGIEQWEWVKSEDALGSLHEGALQNPTGAEYNGGEAGVQPTAPQVQAKHVTSGCTATRRY
jgi:hypothetical protein